jgi:hypothetical protein
MVVMKVEQLLKYYQKTVDTHHAAEQASVIECALNILLQKNKDEIIKKITVDFVDDSPSIDDFQNYFKSNMLECRSDEQAIWFLLEEATLFWQVLFSKCEVELKELKSIPARIIHTDEDDKISVEEMLAAIENASIKE